MKSLLTSAAILAIAATALTTPATSQTSGSGQANPPAAGQSGRRSWTRPPPRPTLWSARPWLGTRHDDGAGHDGHGRHGRDV